MKCWHWSIIASIDRRGSPWAYIFPDCIGQDLSWGNDSGYSVSHILWICFAISSSAPTCSFLRCISSPSSELLLHLLHTLDVNLQLEGAIPVRMFYVRISSYCSCSYTFFCRGFHEGPFYAILHGHIQRNPKLHRSAISIAKNVQDLAGDGGDRDWPLRRHKKGIRSPWTSNQTSKSPTRRRQRQAFMVDWFVQWCEEFAIVLLLGVLSWGIFWSNIKNTPPPTLPTKE